MDKKISELDLVTTLDSGDVLPIVNQATTKKVTVAKIIDGLATTAYVNSQDALKVDKIVGKGLSTEDYTTTEKNKLSGIAEGAEVNVNADWNSVSGDSQILNKPTIPSAQVNSDWNATSGVAQILNKPTIPTAVTQTSQLTNNGSDGVNPFITALDIPTAGQASTLVREVKNMTGATLTKGTVVYISGANGNKPIVSKALATTDALSSQTFGLLQSDILNNGLGNCVIIGDLTGLNTSTFTEGDQLYLSGVTAGNYTASKILAPTHLVYVGKVTRSHPTLGQIEVGIQNGYELEEIHDVAISGLANEDFLQYESTTDLWKNKPLTDTLIKSKLGITTLSGSNTGDNATNTQYSGLESSKANIDSPTFTGTPSLPTGTTGTTQTPLNNSTRLATTAYVESAVAVVSGTQGVQVSSQSTFPTTNIATVTASEYSAFIIAGTVSATTLYFITA